MISEKIEQNGPEMIFM